MMVLRFDFDGSFRRTLVCVLAVAASLSGGVGCSRDDGTPIGTVQGVVTLNENPLAGVEVVFQPETGRPSLGTTDSSGRYQMRYSVAKMGAMVGSHRVSVVHVTPDQEDPNYKAPTFVIPKKYNEKTELTADVKKGRNTINFELMSE